jgi:hypothetical protein
VSDKVGIDFTELRPGAEKQEDLITIGFRFKLKERAIIQDYHNRMCNQFLVSFQKLSFSVRNISFPKLAASIKNQVKIKIQNPTPISSR